MCSSDLGGRRVGFWLLVVCVCWFQADSCVCSRLEVQFTGKTVGIVVKSSKTLQEAISSVLQKHQLRHQDVTVTMVSSAWGCVCVRERR